MGKRRGWCLLFLRLPPLLSLYPETVTKMQLNMLRYIFLQIERTKKNWMTGGRSDYETKVTTKDGYKDTSFCRSTKGQEIHHPSLDKLIAKVGSNCEAKRERENSNNEQRGKYQNQSRIGGSIKRIAAVLMSAVKNPGLISTYILFLISPRCRSLHVAVNTNKVSRHRLHTHGLVYHLNAGSEELIL